MKTMAEQASPRRPVLFMSAGDGDGVGDGVDAGDGVRDDAADALKADPAGDSGTAEHPAAATAPAMLDVVEYPRGRLGTGVQKAQEKLDSIIANLATPHWRVALRETTLRGVSRSCAGLEKDLAQSEFPNMVKINQEQNSIVRHLLDLCLATAALQKEDRAANVARFKAPLDALEQYKAKTFRGGALCDFDCELELLKVLCCRPFVVRSVRSRPIPSLAIRLRGVV